MRHFLFLAAAAIAASGQIPQQDPRNTNVPNTDTHFRMPEYRTLAEWQARAGHLKKQILFAAGLYPLPAKTPLKPLVFGRIENKDYSIEKVAIETIPGYWLGGNLYRPLGKPGRHPAVASPHGHWNYGRLEHGQNGSIPARAINLARQGYVVFAYDMVGYNDTMQTPHAFGDHPRDQAWSFGPLGLQLWNSIRAVDFLESLPDVDASRIGATGASGGGTQTFLLAAVDDRIKFAAPVNMISAIMQGGSPCENAPGLRVGANNMEFGAIMAPRPMIMVSATGDWTRNTPKEEYPAIRRIYELHDAAGKLESVQIDAPHNYNKASREAVYRFFASQVLRLPNASGIEEQNIRVEKLQDMLVWHGRALPQGALDFEGVHEAWISMGKQQTAAVTDREGIRERLQLALASEWPQKVIAERQGERVVLSREGRGDRVTGLLLGNGKAQRVVVHPAGLDAARSDARVKELTARGESVLLIEAFQTGSAKAPRDRSHRHFLTFNKTEDAERVQDILTALRWLQIEGANNLRITGLGDASVWAVFAAAAAPGKVTVDGQPGNAEFFAPGIERAGGLKAARVLAGIP
jgi:dienelactone hydrolase